MTTDSDHDPILSLLEESCFQHADDAELLSMIDGTANSATQARLQAHLDLCLICERRFAVLREMHDSLFGAVHEGLGSTSTTAPQFHVLPSVPAEKTTQTEPVVIPIAFALRGVAEKARQWAEKRVGDTSPDDELIAEVGNAQLEKQSDGTYLIRIFSDEISRAGVRYCLRWGDLSSKATYSLWRRGTPRVYAEYVLPRRPVGVDIHEEKDQD